MTGPKAVGVFAPKPDYPYGARSRHVTGSGVAILTVDVASGNVTDASMAQSIGSPILGNSTTSTFRRWRFRPGAAAPRVKGPITYTMSGASYYVYASCFTYSPQTPPHRAHYLDRHH